MAKHLCIKFPNEIVFCSGKASDIKFAVSTHINEGKLLTACIFHFTRTQEQYISYEALESVKDGIFFSGKYESKQCIFNSPHVIVFANFPPDKNNLSLDRWKITEI